MGSGTVDPERTFGLAALAAVIAAVVFGYPLLLDVPLLDPTEGLHASIAQEMVEQDRWLMPQLLGEPFLDKPILHFWAEAGSLAVFGMHEPAARLPGMLFGLLAAGATGLLAGRMFGTHVGLIAGIFHATMLLPAALVQFPTTDVAMIPWVVLSIWLFWEADRAHSRPHRVAIIVALGLTLGLCALAKGVVGIAVVGVAYGGYLLVTRRLDTAACVRAVLALSIAGLIASTWFLAVEAQVPGYLRYYFIERTVLGFTTDTQTHGGKPWWYYLPVLLIGGMPWIGYLPAAFFEQRHWSASAARQPRREHRRAMTLLWCWLVGGVLLFSLAGSKLMTYLWPVMPPVAVLAAVAWGGLIAGTLGDRARASLTSTLRWACLAGPGVLVAVMLAGKLMLGIDVGWLAWTIGVVVAITALLPWMYAQRHLLHPPSGRVGRGSGRGGLRETRFIPRFALPARSSRPSRREGEVQSKWHWMYARAGRSRACLTTATLSVAAQLALVMTVLVPQAAEQHSARALAEHFNRRGTVPRRLLLAEERIGSLLFYLDAPLRERLANGRLRQVRLATLAAIRPGTVVVLPERAARNAAVRFRLEALPYRRVARYRLYDGAVLAAALRGDTRRVAAMAPAQSINQLTLVAHDSR